MKNIDRWVLWSVFAMGLLFVVLSAGVWATAPFQSVEDFYQAAVLIESEHGPGSGCEGWYAGKVWVLTAGHVVEGCGSVNIVEDQEGFRVSRKATVRMLDSAVDLALLTTDERGPVEKSLPSLEPVSSVSLGDPLWYSGSGAGTKTWMEKTHVARFPWKGHGHYDGFLATGKGWYGSSGSAVVTSRYGQARLAGVLCCSSATYCGGEVHKFAPLGCQGPRVIKDFLERATK